MSRPFGAARSPPYGRAPPTPADRNRIAGRSAFTSISARLLDVGADRRSNASKRDSGRACGSTAFSTANLAVEHVARDFEIERARMRRRRTSRAAIAIMSATRSVVSTLGGELGDRPHHLDVRQVLQRAHLVLGEPPPAADMQHRALGAECGRDAGHRIGAAGARGGDDAAELAGLARIAVGGVGRHLLVADVDDPDALVDAAVIDVDDVAAAEGEDGVDALRSSGPWRRACRPRRCWDRCFCGQAYRPRCC